MSRYYDPDASVTDLVKALIFERFPGIRTARVKVLMDSKTKVDKLRDAPTFASIKLANEVEKFLTKDGHNLSGIDYIMFISAVTWELADAVSKKRLISHELRHCFVDENGNYKIVDHDIQDFYAEVKLNEDDPMWAQALGTIVMAKLDQLKAEEKAAKKAARG